MFTYQHIFLSFTLFTMLWIDIYVVSTSVIANGVSQNNDLLLPIGDPEVNSFASRSWMEDNMILKFVITWTNTDNIILLQQKCLVTEENILYATLVFDHYKF